MEAKLLRVIRKTIEDIEWWKSKCIEEHIRESMQRSLDNLKFYVNVSDRTGE